MWSYAPRTNPVGMTDFVTIGFNPLKKRKDMCRAYGTLVGSEVFYRWAKAAALQNRNVPTALQIRESENQLLTNAPEITASIRAISE